MKQAEFKDYVGILYGFVVDNEGYCFQRIIMKQSLKGNSIDHHHLWSPASVLVLVHNEGPHLPVGEVRVGEEVSHLAVAVVDIVEQVPLDVVILVVSVAVDGGAVVIGHVPQLVGLEPGLQY